jgi:hypothetical protein
MYAKLQKGMLISAPRTVKWHGYTVNNPSGEKLVELGYKPVVYTDMPETTVEGKHYESGWTEAETEIVQTWNLVEDPEYPESELSSDEALNIIMGVVQ